MNSNRTLVILAASLSLAAALSACGGGGGSEPEGQQLVPPPSQPNWNHPVTAVNNTFTLTAGVHSQPGEYHSGYEGNALNLGAITATPDFGKLSTFHYQNNMDGKDATHLMFYGQVLPRSAWVSVTVVADDGTTTTLNAADAKFTHSPLNQDGSSNANTATYWSWPGNVFDFKKDLTYTVTFK